MERGELPAAEKESFLATYFVGLFRAMRFGINEAHGRGAAFQFGPGRVRPSARQILALAGGARRQRQTEHH